MRPNNQIVYVFAAVQPNGKINYAVPMPIAVPQQLAQVKYQVPEITPVKKVTEVIPQKNTQQDETENENDDNISCCGLLGNFLTSLASSL